MIVSKNKISCFLVLLLYIFCNFKSTFIHIILIRLYFIGLNIPTIVFYWKFDAFKKRERKTYKKRKKNSYTRNVLKVIYIYFQ